MKASRIIKFFLILFAFILITSSFMVFAKAVITKKISDQASVAKFIIKTTQITNNSNLILDQSMTNNLYTFAVSNYEDNNVCEITTTYDIIITCPISSSFLDQIKIKLVCNNKAIDCSYINKTPKETIYVFDNVGVLQANNKTEQICNIYFVTTTEKINYLHCEGIVVDVLVEQINKEI